MSDDRPQSPAAASQVLRQRVMPKTVRDVLRAIIALASWPQGIARVSMATLAAELGESERNARRKVKEAGNPPKGLGLLEQTANRGGRSNVSAFRPCWEAIASLPASGYADHKPGHLRPGFEDANPDTCAPLSAQEPGHVRPGLEVGNPDMGAPNPDTGAQNPGACAPRSYLHDLHHHQERHESVGATPPAVDGGGGDSLSRAVGFDGDLARAVEALKSMRVNRAEHLARQAGSERAVLYAVEQAKAPGVKNRAAFAARLISDGERPHEGWRSPGERASTPTHPAILGDRSAQATEHQLARARNEAELALIARFPDIADAAAERFIAEGHDVDGHVARKGRTHRVAREAVLAAIEAETGERANPGATSNARPKRAREMAG